jgi:hypothetical protein
VSDNDNNGGRTMMETIQALEERFFDPQSDAVNALAMSRMMKPDSDAIPDDGRFHVCTNYTYYCPSTDAIAGEVRTLAESFDTRLEAEEYAGGLQDEIGDADMWVTVHPEKQNTPAPLPEISEDDMPF